MNSLRTRLLTPVVTCTGILAFGAILALAGLNEWYDPARRPFNGKAAPFYLFSNLLWGPRGPAYAYWLLAALWVSFGLAVCAAVVRKSIGQRAYQRILERNAL